MNSNSSKVNSSPVNIPFSPITTDRSNVTSFYQNFHNGHAQMQEIDD